MRKLAYIPSVIFTLCMIADLASTAAVFSLPQPQTMAIGESHPFGYPGVLALLFIYPPIFFAISFGITKVKSETVFMLLLVFFIGFLIPFYDSSLKAIGMNLDTYQRIINERR